MACVFKPRINPKFNRPCNFEGVAGFEKQTELPQYECRIKTQTSSTFGFNRLSNSNDKVLTIPLGFLIFFFMWQQQGENQLTA